MKLTIKTILFLLFVQTSLAQTQEGFELYALRQDSLMRKAYDQRDTKTYLKLLNDFLPKYEKLFQGDKAKYRPLCSKSFYNLSCIYSLLDDKIKAVEYLQRAMRTSFMDFDQVKKDPDLDNIRNEENFKALVEPLYSAGEYIVKRENAYATGNYDSLIFYAQQLVLIGMKNQNSFPDDDKIISLSDLAYAMWWTGNYPEAKEVFFKMLEKAEALDDTLMIGAAYNGLAIVTRNSGDYSQAIVYYSKAESLTKHIPDNDVLMAALSDKGKSYEQLNMLDSALVYSRAALAIMARKYHDKDGPRGGVQAGMGAIYSKMGNKKMAEEYFRQSFRSNIEINEIRLLARGYSEFAEHFDRYDQHDSAIHYATKGLIIDRQFHFLVQQLAASTLLTKLYTQENKIDSAFKYQSLMIGIKDSLFSREKISRLQAIEFNAQLRHDELEKEKAETKNKIIRYTLLAGSGVFLLVALILYRNNRNKQKANKVLETTLTNLRSAQSQLIQSEKMASLGELTAGIAHEIQNPLNFVNNFSEVSNELVDEMTNELSKGDLEEAKAIAGDIKQNLEKINHHGKKAEAIVKGMMQHSRSSRGVKEATDLNDLADEYLRLSYHGMHAKDATFDVTIKTDFDEAIGNMTVIPQDIGRVLLNLINNAFYAVSAKASDLGKTLPDKLATADNRYEPTVWVSTKKMGDEVLISVRDNGQGIPQKILDKMFQPFFTTKPAGQGTGLGLSLAYDIVKAHGGEIKVETMEGEGSEFVVSLPT